LPRPRKPGESTSPWPPTSWPERSELSEAASKTVEIVNKRGLHARASAKFVKLAAAFDAEVKVSKDGSTVDARSIMGLMMLAAGPGCCVDIEAEGPQAEEAVAALADLVAAKFEEDE
jgi:phosphocarrier protein HPr